MTAGKSISLRLYVNAVVAAGLALAVLLALRFTRPDAIAASPWEFAVFAALVVLGECHPLQIRRQHRRSEMVTSTAFAFAILLGYGMVSAIAVQLLASVVADLRAHKNWQRVLFNAGQYSLSFGLSGLICRAVTHGSLITSADQITSRTMVAIAAAAGTYFLFNNLLIGVVVSLHQHSSLLDRLRQEFVFEAVNNAVLLALGPIVLVVGERSLPLVPVLLLPVMVVYRSARVSMENEHQALHDALTGLPNRVLFQSEAESALASAQGRDGMVAVMLIDLDRFKEVNDTLGHSAGDELLRKVGPRVRAVVREGATVSRLGGDEFAVLVPDLAAEHAALAIAERIVEGLETPFEVDGIRLDLEASIGIALSPLHGEDVDVLMQRADVAMYVAKSTRTRCELYSSERDHHSRQRLGLLGELRNAVAERQLVVHYQPKIAIATEQVIGVEALVRWQHPERGLLTPDEFVPLAEHTGLIRPLTDYVLGEALAQHRRWRHAGLEVPVAVNLSTRNLHDLDLPTRVAEALRHSGLPATAIELEITESTIMADPLRARRILAALHDMGVRMAIDDFGTGYSSLAYLKRLPVSELKIDKSFVLNMANDDSDRTIVRSTVDLARNLGLQVVAEGVESAPVLALLRELGCHGAQGYYLSRPLSPDALVAWFLGRVPALDVDEELRRLLDDVAPHDAGASDRGV